MEFMFTETAKGRMEFIFTEMAKAGREIALGTRSSFVSPKCEVWDTYTRDKGEAGHVGPTRWKSACGDCHNSYEYAVPREHVICPKA